MKKITFLLSLLITTVGYSQEFPLDFEDAADDNWGAFNGAAVSVKDDGSGSNNVLELISNGVDFDGASLGLATAVDLSDAANNTISITVDPQDALGASEERTHLIKFEGGVGGPAIAEVFFTTTGPDEQTINANFPSGLGTFATIVLFADSGAGNTATGTYWFDDLTVVADPAPTCTDGIENGDEEGVDCGGSCPNACAQPPTTLPTAPARPVADVLSVVSPAYTDETPSGVQTFAGATIENYTVVTTEDTRLLTTPAPGGGAQFGYFFGTDTGFDLTTFTTLHIDVWFMDAGEAGSVLTLQLQNFDTVSGAFQHNIFTNIDVNSSGAETWVSADIDLSTFTNSGLARNNIQQIQLIAQGPAFGPTYFSNLYFHKGTVLGTDEFESANFNVSPNPSTNVWNIKGQQTIDKIEVYDVLGKQVITVKPNDSDFELDASTLPKGLYFARLTTDVGSGSIKLIKN